MLTLRIYIILGAAFVIAVLSFYAGYTYAQAKWLKVAAEADKNYKQQLHLVIEEHNKKLYALEAVNEKATSELQIVVAAADNANRASNKLQQQLDSISNTAKAKAPTVNRECTAASTAVLVLTDVLRRADRRAGDLAATADQARVRGLACEAFYNTVVNSHH